MKKSLSNSSANLITFLLLMSSSCALGQDLERVTKLTFSIGNSLNLGEYSIRLKSGRALELEKGDHLISPVIRIGLGRSIPNSKTNFNVNIEYANKIREFTSSIIFIEPNNAPQYLVTVSDNLRYSTLGLSFNLLRNQCINSDLSLDYGLGVSTNVIITSNAPVSVFTNVNTSSNSLNAGIRANLNLKYAINNKIDICLLNSVLIGTHISKTYAVEEYRFGQSIRDFSIYTSLGLSYRLD